MIQLEHKTAINLHLLKAVVNQINEDSKYGDYTAVEGLFSFLDKPMVRLREFLGDDT
jgi:hypothetical protein